MPQNLSTPQIIVVLGPTASGKSELAVKIALRLGSGQAKKLYGINSAEIISADSRQVYKGLDIGSGKVPRDKLNLKSQISKIQLKNQKYFYKGIRHHLLDIASPKRVFTVAQYQKLAKKALADILKRGKIPIICGGTGLYIDALLYDYQFPKVPPQPKIRKKLEKFPTEKLFEKLQKLDPWRAQNIDKNNRRRLIRALEIIITTKKPIPKLKKTSAYNVLKIGIKKSPVELKKKIQKRIKKMIKSGLIRETKNLCKSGLSWKRIYELGFEYKYPAMFLQNKITKEEMLNKMISENIKYSKRQMTWFKRDREIFWIEHHRKAENLTKNFLK